MKAWRVKRRSLVLALGTLALPWVGGAHAADSGGQYAIRGAGAQSCQAFVEDVSDPPETLGIYLRWLEGYMSAVNLHQEDTFDAVPFSGSGEVANLLVNVCRDNGQMRLETALAQLLNTLRPARITADSEAVELAAHGQTLTLRRQSLRQVQSALAAAGFYNSRVDGLYGPGTRRALEAYQEQRGYEVTGLPDARTLLSLLVR